MTEQRPSRDERISAAALDLLRTKGPAAVTVEAVAARSGVAKTTIYRRYRNRNDMLTAALASITEPPPPTNPSELVPVVEWLVEQSYRAVHDGIGAGGLAALLTDENRDYTQLLRSIVHQHRAALASVIRDAMNNQVVRGDIDVETVMDCIAGAYLAELARSGSVAPRWTERVLRTMLPALETANLKRSARRRR
jgi:AcrR family transcriptional regulator